MNTSITLTAAEFKQIHNALCFAHTDGIQKTVETIRAALANAYAQDDAVFDRKMDYFRRFQEDNKLETIWSIYELEEHGFLKDHPYSSDAFVCYQGQHVPVFGNTWGDIYRAADWAIRNSGDQHHIFIEAFELKNGNELHLVTGS
jgi:dienelactone hydrolase